MDYTVFMHNTLTELGIDLVPIYNCYDPPYNPTLGWPLKLPTVEFKSNTVVLLHFQDFVTFRDNIIVELDRVEKFYGQYSNQILVTHMHHGLEKVYHGPVNLIEYSNHNCREMTRLQARWDECRLELDKPKTKAWQCLNGRMCSHRRRAVDILQSWDNGWLSYGPEIPLPLWDYSTYRGTENDENFVRLLPVYGSAAVNIVTETQYDHRPGVICEKTLFAMVAQQIPILIGYPGIIADCKEMGFDMFEDVVDTSYDFLPNEERVEQAILRNQDLIQGRVDISHLKSRLQEQSTRALLYTENYYRTNFINQSRKLAIQRLTSP